MTTAKDDRRKRKVPGCACPDCGCHAYVVKVKRKSHGKPLATPVRSFVCACGKRYTYPATDLAAVGGLDWPPASNHSDQSIRPRAPASQESE